MDLEPSACWHCSVTWRFKRVVASGGSGDALLLKLVTQGVALASGHFQIEHEIFDV
ncbi:MAG: hypothetical protein KatS3mg114_1195 [Planctomycetaceae bacterium]|nr:MAG: hypothetical protein KatS3mg114_1195 [Planctomycetaceae bacterium]